MKNTLFTIACLLPLLAACTETLPPGPSARDNTFEIGARLYYDPARLCYGVSLSLLSGPEGDYTIAYVIDGMKTTGVTLEGGARLDSGQPLMLSRAVPQELKLPSSGRGRHRVDLVVMRAGLERRASVEYDEDAPLYASVEAGEEVTMLTVEDTGRTGECTLSFKLDNDEFRGVMRDGAEVPNPCVVDFRETPQMVFSFPEIPAGDHTVTVLARTQHREHTMEVPFTEPLRSAVEVSSSYESAYMAHALSLSLSRGSRAAYRVVYTVDGDPTLRLRTSTGGDFNSGSELVLTGDAPAVLLLPSTGMGQDHTVTLVFERDGFSQRETVTYRDRNVLAGRVEPGPDGRAVLKLTPTGGPAVLKVRFTVDGQSYSGMSYNGVTGREFSVGFSPGEDREFVSGPLKMGDHSLGVEVSNSFAREEQTLYFTVVKQDALQLVFSFDTSVQKMTLASHNNHAKESVQVRLECSLGGRIWYMDRFNLPLSTRAVTALGHTNFSSWTPEATQREIDGGMFASVVRSLESEWNWSDGRTNGLQQWKKHCWESHALPVSGSVVIRLTGPEGHEGRTPASVTVTPLQFRTSAQSWYHRPGETVTVYPRYTVITTPDVEYEVELGPHGEYVPLEVVM